MRSVAAKLTEEQLAALRWLRDLRSEPLHSDRGSALYGEVFKGAFLETGRARVARGGSPLPIEDMAWRVVSASITHVTNADKQVAEALFALLGIHEGAVLSVLTGVPLPENAILPPIGRHDVEAARGALEKRMGNPVFEFLRAAHFAAGSLAWDRWDGFCGVATCDHAAAMLGAEAHLEAATLLTVLHDQVYSEELVSGYALYYVGRRTGDPFARKHGVARLIADASAPDDRHGMAPEGPDSERMHGMGPLEKLARRQHENSHRERYERLPAAGREIVGRVYYDKFLRVLDGLPVEAMLHPAKTIAYAGTSALRGAKDSWPPWVEVSIDPDAGGGDHPEAGSWEGAEDTGVSWLSVEEEDGTEVYLNLPHGDLAGRVYLDGVTNKTELAREFRVSRPTVYKWLEAWAQAGRQLCATGVVPERRSKRARAAAVLREILQDGPRLAREVKAEAKARGVKPAELELAKKDLGIKPRKDGFRGPWIWELPPAEPTSQMTR